MITAKDNPKIKQVRSLQADSKFRRQEKAFVVEGARLVEEALASGWETQRVLFTEELSERGRALVEGFAKRGTPVDLVSASVMVFAADTQTPQGILAVVSTQTLPLPDRLDFVLIPDCVRDPGNLGTMLRTAAAAGVGAVLLPTGSADPFSPKVLRAAMGAHFRLPIWSISWQEIAVLVNRHGLAAYLADSASGLAFSDADLVRPFALIIGGEAEGASQQAQILAVQRVHIPMPGGSESLNAASAAAVLLFETVRQRSISKRVE
jgi:TrmH family RNA methyltransferase